MFGYQQETEKYIHYFFAIRLDRYVLRLNLVKWLYDVSSNIPQKISSKCEMNGMLIFCHKKRKKSPFMFTMTKDNNNIAMDLIHIEHGQYYHP